MTDVEISKLSDKKLFAYFSETAGYFRDAPDRPYHIRWAGKSIFSADTNDLYKRFRKAVRAWKPPVLVHIWNWHKKKRGNGNECRCNYCDTKRTKKNVEKSCPVRMENAGYKKTALVEINHEPVRQL